MSSIDKARWDVLSRALDDLLDLEPTARAARLAEIAHEDPPLAAELQELLREHEAVSRKSFLEEVAINPLADVGAPGEVIDRYTLDRQIGEGGMGAVWLAHRSDGRFEGQVAIKFVRLLATGTGGARRFEREGHVLARLRHPNIAQLLDAGITPGGCPYLVLEYIEGEPIDSWCQTRALDTHARINLFLQVLAAVSHAHGKLILHRDLKPSNILVTRDGQVKLLDFGIAKLLEQESTGAATEMTQIAGRAFTLDYAAPEQVQGGEVTTATDVYSLGVLLYVLLTGQHPTSEAARTPAERLRAIVETEPTRPSALVAKTGSSAIAVSSAHHARLLRGDLDNIIAKALKKEPDERYPTADAFAQDLRRYLQHEPVSARPDSIGYRLRKFLARNALAASAATIVAIAIVAAAIVSLWQAREARAQRDRALVLSARNAAVVDFVSGMLTDVAPDDRPIRVPDLLDRSEEVLLKTYVDPEHQAAILDVLADYYLSIGDAAKAQLLLERALQLTEHAGDPILRGTLVCSRAFAISLQNQRDEALVTIQPGIEMSRADPSAAARCLEKRAFIAHNFNDPQAALEYAEAARDALSRATHPNPTQEASLIADLAYAHYLGGRAAEADRYYAEALARYQQLGRGESPVTFSLRNNWGIASFAAGDVRRALEQYEEALAIVRKRNPDADPPTYLISNRALALAALARYPEAIAGFDETLAAGHRANNVSAQLHALVNRAGTYLTMGDTGRAERELRELQQQYASLIPPDSVPATTIRLIEGRLAAAQGNLDLALKHLDSAVAFFDARQMNVAPLTRALGARAQVHLQRGDVALARADATRALEISRSLQGGKPYSNLTGASLLQLAQIEATEDGEKAEALAREAYEHLNESLHAEHPDALKALELASEPRTRTDTGSSLR